MAARLELRPALVARFEGVRYADEATRESWAVIQVLGTRLDEAPGVVLVLDRARNEWRALYEVLSGGSKRLNFPMYNMVMSGDKLYATLCTHCSSWGNYDDFEINLRTHRATRLATAPETGGRRRRKPNDPRYRGGAEERYCQVITIFVQHMYTRWRASVGRRQRIRSTRRRGLRWRSLIERALRIRIVLKAALLAMILSDWATRQR